MGVTRVAVVVRPGDQPITEGLLLRLAEPLLRLHQSEWLATHAGDGCRGGLGTCWFNSWTSAAGFVPAPAREREYRPCPVCDGTGEACLECDGVPWRADWPIDRTARRAGRMASAVESGEIAAPH